MGSETVLGKTGNGNKDYQPDMVRLEKVIKSLIKMRIHLLCKHAFWGTLAVRFRLVDATAWMPTCAVDGENFYFNIDFVESLSQDELKFVFAHEILHCAYDHFLRRDERDPQLWNAAADYAVNRDLKYEKIGKMPSVGLYDQKYDDMTAEQIFEKLKEECKDSQQLKTLDVHLDGSEADDGDGGSGEGWPIEDGPEGSGISKGPPKPKSEAEQKKASDEFRQEVANAAKAAGEAPAGIKDLIKEWTEPQIDWRGFLEETVKSLIKDDYSWQRISRRGMGLDLCLPGMKTADTIDVCITVDTSGSMSDDMLRDFLGEVYGIMSQYQNFKVRIWTFDTKCYGYKEFTEDNLEEIHEYQIQGRGGTDFMCNWDFMEKEEIEPNILIFMTDGYPCGEWGKEEYCDVIYLIHSDPGKNIKGPSWATTLHYDRSTGAGVA